jgi:hypothetical protein
MPEVKIRFEGEEVKDGEIQLNSTFAQKLGFTDDKFISGSYLWKKGNTIIVSFIASLQPGKGHFSNLLNKIQKLGYKIEVPTPFPKMKAILLKKGFIKKMKFVPDYGEHIEIMVSQPLTLHQARGE